MLCKMAVDTKSRETRQRLEKCWSADIDWEKIPLPLKKACAQIGKALCVPPTAVLGGLLTITSYIISPSVVQVPNTEWSEPVLIWLSINMPTGCSKSALYQYLNKIVLEVRKQCGYTSLDPVWLLGDATCEKMGDLMAANSGRLLGLYDELISILTQLNLYRGKGLTMSHELALFLQLYNGHSWVRTTVTGEANFTMETTSLVVGGLSQPNVARTLIEQSGSIETGLAQRFMWLFPKPTYAKFEELEAVNEEYTQLLVHHLSKQWQSGKAKKPEVKSFTIGQDSEVFKHKFNQVQDELQALASMDDLLSAADEETQEISSDSEEVSREACKVSEKAVSAAINFVELCLQQTAFIAGRGDIKNDIEVIKSTLHEEVADTSSQDSKGTSPEAVSLRLPGRTLHLTPLLKDKKFRSQKKAGALLAWENLEKAELGRVQVSDSQYGRVYKFEKVGIPEDAGELASLAKKLAKFGVSISEYKHHLEKQEIFRSKSSTKNKRDGGETSAPSPKKRCTNTPPTTPSKKGKSPHSTPNRKNQ